MKLDFSFFLFFLSIESISFKHYTSRIIHPKKGSSQKLSSFILLFEVIHLQKYHNLTLTVNMGKIYRAVLEQRFQ